MKIFRFIFYIVIVTTFNSCVTDKDIFRFNFDSNKGGTGDVSDFIEFNDGRIIKGDISKFVLHVGLVGRNSSTVTMDNVKYNTSDIKIFQVDSNYYRKMPSAKYFIQRKRGDKVNLYYKHVSKSGTDSRGRPYGTEYDLHYLQKGNDGEIKEFSVKTLVEMVSDNQQALNYIEEYKNKSNKNRDQYLGKAIDAYNGKNN